MEKAEDSAEMSCEIHKTATHHLTRRNLLKQFAIQGLAWSLPMLAKAGNPKKQTPSFMRGVNTYYLLVEAYRHVQKNSGRNVYALVYEYLVDKLRLPEVQEKCNINAIRYWAFNDYPAPDDKMLPHTTDGRLWKNGRQVDLQALEVLAAVTDILIDLGFFLIPVLSNYWSSYGGILQYLVWTGELTKQDYIDALCTNRGTQLYLENTLRFFSSPKVENLFRQHIRQILPLFADKTSVRVIELMNEPRGKNPLSLANKPLKNGLMSSDMIAKWLNRQAVWIQRNDHFRRYCPYISSGEEGWLEDPVASVDLKSLAKGGQYYEGIDLLKNVSAQADGITIASIHMYTHMAAKLKKTNNCGYEFVDQRGWAHLSNDTENKGRSHFIDLADDWIRSRARVLKPYPWYIGEMAWPWREEEKHFPEANSIDSPLKKYYTLYRHWESLARQNGAQGVFLWMLDGLEHKDLFYGLNLDELALIITGRGL